MMYSYILDAAMHSAELAFEKMPTTADAIREFGGNKHHIDKFTDAWMLGLPCEASVMADSLIDEVAEFTTDIGSDRTVVTVVIGETEWSFECRYPKNLLKAVEKANRDGTDDFLTWGPSSGNLDAPVIIAIKARRYYWMALSSHLASFRKPL